MLYAQTAVPCVQLVMLGDQTVVLCAQMAVLGDQIVALGAQLVVLGDQTVVLHAQRAVLRARIVVPCARDAMLSLSTAVVSLAPVSPCHRKPSPKGAVRLFMSPEAVVGRADAFLAASSAGQPAGDGRMFSTRAPT